MANADGLRTVRVLRHCATVELRRIPKAENTDSRPSARAGSQKSLPQDMASDAE